jgi:diguanylate cyclase (GGDEF)-like protein/PAS domain S-box-containing protein
VSLVSLFKPAPSAAALARLVRLAARAADAPAALLLSGDAPTVCTGADAWRDSALTHALARDVVAGARELRVTDAAVHPHAGPDAWAGERGWLGVPVRAPGGAVAGCLCVVDARPRPWSDDDADTLASVAELLGPTLHAPPGIDPAVAGFAGALAGSRGRMSLRVLEKAVETMQIGVTITDTEGRILYTNPAEARMHGYTVDELRGRHARLFAPPERHHHIDLDEGVTSWSRETVNVRRDGTPFPVLLRSDVVLDSQGRPAGLVTCCEDLTQRKALEHKLLRNAFYDQLTGLPNRGLLTHRLDLAVDRAGRGDGGFAVLMVGLDRFKRVNDGLGRAAGDELLRAVGQRMHDCIHPDSMLARMSGDEFAVLLDDAEGVREAVRVARCLQAALDAPFALQAGEVFTRASVGIALSLTGYDRSEDVLRDAAIAMYRCKDGDPGGYQVFDLAMHAQAMERLRMEGDLRRALERGELRVHYQPVVELATGRVAGFEALARWEHPERGLLFPDAFIPLAEETGMILPLGLRVLEEACMALARLQRRPGWERLGMAVNLSARQFSHAGTVERVAAALDASGIAPGTLKLEITESVILQLSAGVSATMAGLKALGVELYLDDFGTGYSSLAYLHRVPLDALKIDRSFVGPDAGAESHHLVRTIVAMARALDVAVVTEGVEREETLRELRHLGCEYAQGYYFAHPMSEHDACALLDADPRW